MGRTARMHPREALLRGTRQLQDSLAYDQYRHRQMVAEHRLARLVQLGFRQAKYLGLASTKFHVYMTTAVVNLTVTPPLTLENPGPKPFVAATRVSPTAQRFIHPTTNAPAGVIGCR